MRKHEKQITKQPESNIIKDVINLFKQKNKTNQLKTE